MTLTEFLLARVAEDDRWWSSADMNEYAYRVPEKRKRLALAECEAKRRIVELHTPVDAEPDSWCVHCDGDGWPCGTMAALASVYADHSDYREEWRP